MKKTILYIGGFILPDGNAAAQRVLSNAKAFRSLGYRIVFVGVKSATRKDIKDNYLKDTLIYEEKYPKRSAQWFKKIVSVRNIKKIVNEIGSNKIVAVIAYNYPAIVLLRLIPFCRKENIKLMSDCTEWATEYSWTSIRSIIKNIDTYLRMTFAHPKLDGIIVISRYLYEYYSKRMDNVFQIPPLIDCNEKKWKNPSKFKSKDINLIYAGSPGTGLKDRLDIVIDALSQLNLSFEKTIKLTIIGISKEQYLSINKNRLPENIRKQVVFKGYIPHRQVIREIQKAAYSIFFRHNNTITKAGFPTKFVESLSCGTPVLTNATSNISEYLNDQNFGYLINIESMDKTVETLNYPLSLDTAQIESMKRVCIESKEFHFENYIPIFKRIIDCIECLK